MEVGPVGYGHLAFFGVFLPWVAFKSSRKLGSRPLPPKVSHFTSQIIVLAFFLVISGAVARLEWIDVLPRRAPAPGMVLLGAVVLVALVVLMRPLWRSRVAARSRKVWLFMPRTRQERFLWAGCSLMAGFSEEVTYRGVMFALLWRLTGSPIAAALISAAVFSISHYLQGWKSMAIIFAMALAFQGLAQLSGSLYVSMAVHALYDMAAGYFYGVYGEKLGYPIEPMPA